MCRLTLFRLASKHLNSSEYPSVDRREERLAALAEVAAFCNSVFFSIVRKWLLNMR